MRQVCRDSCAKKMIFCGEKKISFYISFFRRVWRPHPSHTFPSTRSVLFDSQLHPSHFGSYNILVIILCGSWLCASQGWHGYNNHPHNDHLTYWCGSARLACGLVYQGIGLVLHWLFYVRVCSSMWIQHCELFQHEAQTKIATNEGDFSCLWKGM